MRLTTTALRLATTAAALALVAPVRAAGPTTGAATGPVAAGPRLVRLTLRPVATVEPTLRYPLLPPLANQHPGDAAYGYSVATNRLPPDLTPDHQAAEIWIRFERVEDTPPGPFPVGEAADVLDRFAPALIDDAARCERAHWDVGYREHGIDARLPYLNDLRTLARVSALGGRLALARGDFAGTARAIQTNLAMVRHLDGDAFVILVQSLVASGIETLTLDAIVQEWVSHGASPNLYWSLTSLPPTFADLYTVAESEQALLRFTDGPWTALAMDDRLPADQWFRVVRLAARMAAIRSSPTGPELDAARRRMTAEFVGPARANLRAGGRPASEVAAMSDDEAVGRYLLLEYRSASDRTWRSFTLPFPQAARPLGRADAVVGTPDRPASPFTFGSSRLARYTLAKADEQLAALRVIEALRDHAARHGGRPPASLDDVAGLPVPPDPVTGRPFAYHADGATATLDLPAPADVNPANGRRYELTFVAP